MMYGLDTNGKNYYIFPDYLGDFILGKMIEEGITTKEQVLERIKVISGRKK